MRVFLKINALSLVLFSLATSQSAHGVLLDKIVGIFNNQTVTLSQVKRMQKNLPARRKISPYIYKKPKYSINQLVELNMKQLLIREELSKAGYVISDDRTEARIKETEKKIGLTRKELLKFLRSGNLTFDEYFELARRTIEYDIFIPRMITPLISVTEQEVKNAFYKKNLKNKTLAFKYTLVDFSIERRFVSKKMRKRFRKVLKKFQTSGILPKKFSKMQTNVLEDIAEGGLTKNLKKILKKTDEGSLTRPILLGEDYHVFFVKKKNLVESRFFSRHKKKIRQQLAEKAAAKIEKEWFKREKLKHFVKYPL